MRNFKVQINGNTYEVAVEEMGGTPVQNVVAAPPKTYVTPMPPTAVQTPAPPAIDVKVTPPPSGTSVIAPMPGVILSINVNVGDSVTPNTVIAILEAMKMENEIFAGRTGTIASIDTTKGTSVNTGDAIITLN